MASNPSRFMSRTELLEIVRNGESSGVEFKRDVLQARDLAKAVVALANFEGGVVVLGVEDDGSITGITRDRLEEFVVTTCRDKIRPALIPFYEVVKDVEPNKHVAIVKVTRGLDVHAVWHDNRQAYYMRVGTESREPSTEELSRLFQQRGAFRAELRPVSGARFVDLDLQRLRSYFVHVRQHEVPDDADEGGWTELLFNTELMVDDGITVAAILLFGHTPNRFLPHAGIDAAAFPGVDKEYATRERQALRGPLTPLLSQTGDVVETGLVERAVDFVRRNVPVEGQLDAAGARREERFAYPLEAVREAVVNALVHRDYLLTGTDIELSIFADRLEVVSPGRLPNGITPPRMLTGCRAARNQLLRDIMRDYRYLEHLGMGVRRKIVKGMRDHNGTNPDLIEDGERFTVRLHRGAGPTK